MLRRPRGARLFVGCVSGGEASHAGRRSCERELGWCFPLRIGRNMVAHGLPRECKFSTLSLMFLHTLMWAFHTCVQGKFRGPAMLFARGLNGRGFWEGLVGRPKMGRLKRRFFCRSLETNATSRLEISSIVCVFSSHERRAFCALPRGAEDEEG